MKKLLIVPLALAAALNLATAEESKPDKTLGEKTAETAEKAKEATKDAGRAVADTAKKAAEKVKDAVTPDKDARKVEVRLADGKIEMPSTVESGKTAFVVINAGTSKHNFRVVGEGVEEKFINAVEPKESKTLHVNLKPGTYTVYCPIGEHGEEGMKTTLTVK